MSAAIDIAEALARRLGEARGWRLVANSVHSVDVGMDDNKLCGHYRPPRMTGEVTGSVFIIWEDGAVSRGRIDSNTLGRLPRDIKLWRSLAYRDDDAAHIAALMPPTQVELFDPRVADVVTGDSSPVFDGMSQIAAAAREGGAGVVDSALGCSAVETVIATSSGLWVKYPETNVWCSWSIDKTMSGIRLGRDRETLAGLAHAVSVTGRLAMASRVRLKVDARDMRVVLTPRVVDSFISHYILHNIAGENVAEGRSRYSLDQFREGARVFRSDVSLMIDTAIPMGPGSYLCTSEGIESGRAALVEGGQLVSPILNTKYARRCQMAPTPIPAGGMPPGYAGLTLRAGNMDSWTDLLSGSDDVILVDSVLGMHTQDPTAGNFSLAVPDGIVVRDGQFAGAAKVVISGNFMSAMNEADTRFALSNDDPNPGIELTCHVES